MPSTNIIVALSTKNFGIGKDGNLPWKIKDDLARFSKLTQGSIVVMGRKTWESIPENKRPLKNRVNIIVTRFPSKYNSKDKDNEVYVAEEELESFLNIMGKHQDIFIIGGRFLYEKFMGTADRIYATLVDTDVECDVFYPLENFNKYKIRDISEVYKSEEDLKYRYVNYELGNDNYKHGETQYINLLDNIMTNGKVRDDRTGTGTISLFGPQIRFDISDSIPLLTTKFVPWKLTVKELLWFLKGQTDSKILESQGVNIWKGNTTREFLDNRGLNDYEVGDIGSMYGWIWRHIGAEYKGCNEDYKGTGHDQLSELIDGLKNDPYSRRHMLTTYCPLYNDKGVLLPCHGIVVQFYVEDDNINKKYLSCHMYQRSSDTFLGLAINIASYSILTYIIAEICGMKPKELIITTGDCHIYKNHIEQVKQQMNRSQLPFPKLVLSESLKNKKIEDIVLEDFDVIGYIHHPTIRAPMAV